MGRRKRNIAEAKDLYDNSKESNALFEKYYTAQAMLPEAEWPVFMTAMREGLPVTFRITGFRGHSQSLLKLLRTRYLEDLLSLTDIRPPEPLPWYPSGMAYQLHTNRLAIRKINELQRLHSFLVTETETGHITRQEAVSMVPPLVLDVRSSHRVLDMCAAPGSKTGQMLELLHRGDDSEAGRSSGELPDGLIVANDVDQRRAYMMVHQLKRLQSPLLCGLRPRLQRPDGPPLLFDRVLADVPCSGDGTARKNPGVWRRWKPGHANNLHLTQAKILKRGLELLAVGGRLVYSTCSLNPVENEAVVGKLLLETEGSVELVDVRPLLPGFKSLPGLSSWKVMGANGTLFEKYSDVPVAATTPTCARRYKDLPMERCMRVLPHLQDTGGFFVAALEKRRHLPWMNPPSGTRRRPQRLLRMPALRMDAQFKRPLEMSPKSKRRRFNEDPFLFMGPEHPVWRGISETFGIDSGRFPCGNVLYRCETSKKRHLYLVNDCARRLVQGNPELKTVNMGIKIFSVCDDAEYKGYRPLQEGLSLLEPFITLRRIRVPRCDLLVLLEHELPFSDRFTEATRTAWRALTLGPVVIDYRRDGEDAQQLPDVDLCLAGWRGRTTLRAYMNRHERLHLTRMCGVEDLVEIRGKTAGQGDGEGDDEDGPSDDEEAVEPPAAAAAADGNDGEAE
uniref:tRNA (cytosine(34)-C(5))-methyltransferase n=1 Tax=Macrostomum lignano TaxID=282301 RepID=A0A1I8H1M5_9PLAT